MSQGKETPLETVLQAVALRAAGRSLNAVARELGVSRMTVFRIAPRRLVEIYRHGQRAGRAEQLVTGPAE